VRILYLFHAKSPHFPGRLKPETEAAMKESLWLGVRGESRLAEAGPDDQFLLLGTENHDLNRRPPYYLITAFLNADPAYRDRKLDDGHSGGGQSRADGGRNSFEAYKNLLFARDGQPAGSSHSQVIETSRYQLPAAAILLDRRAFPAINPFAIRNRVLGQIKTAGPDGEGQAIESNSP
jgi:hypothetical protein